MQLVAANQIDLKEESVENLLAISFPKSRAASYEAAMNIARQASRYTEATMGKEIFHYVVFARDKQDASRALVILDYISGMRGAHIYAGGKVIQSHSRLVSVLTCYLESLACNDWKAHCFKIMDSPFVNRDPLSGCTPITISINDLHSEPKEKQTEQYIYPCSFIARYGKTATSIYSNHPAAAEDQVQAKAIEMGCDWCPRFDQHNFRKI